MSVDFPEPFCPTRAWISPERASKSTSRKTVAGPKVLLNVRTDTQAEPGSAIAAVDPGAVAGSWAISLSCWRESRVTCPAANSGGSLTGLYVLVNSLRIV